MGPRQMDPSVDPSLSCFSVFSTDPLIWLRLRAAHTSPKRLWPRGPIRPSPALGRPGVPPDFGRHDAVRLAPEGRRAQRPPPESVGAPSLKVFRPIPVRATAAPNQRWAGQRGLCNGRARRKVWVIPTAPEWRNWQTRQVEGLVAFTGSAGSSPVSGTLKGKDLRLAVVLALSRLCCRFSAKRANSGHFFRFCRTSGRGTSVPISQLAASRFIPANAWQMVLRHARLLS
jgi:hypothetical protein